MMLTVDLQAQQSDRIHTVQPGETLFSIARDFDLTVGDLRSWNRLESDALSPGQTLRIVPPVTEGQITHVVQPGETLFAISRQYDVTVAEIQQWNNLSGPELATGMEIIIHGHGEESEQPRDIGGVLPELPGQEIETQTGTVEEEERQSIVRVSDGSPRGNTYYTVRSGDSLFRIANAHNMSVDELRRLNNLTGDVISVGQQLTVREVRSAPSIAESAEESTPQGRFVTYRVEPGQNSRAIQERFQMSEAELQALNPDVNIATVSPGQQLTVLLPPTRNFANPYKKGANLEDLGTVPVISYDDDEIKNPTTSGELYNPDQLTAAHANMALGNIIYIENPVAGTGIYVRVNDRHSGEGLKISRKAYEMLGFASGTQGPPRVTIYQEN